MRPERKQRMMMHAGTRMVSEAIKVPFKQAKQLSRDETEAEGGISHETSFRARFVTNVLY